MESVKALGDIRGKVAVITGGSRGIGRAVAEAVVNNGGYVVIGDILEKEGQITAKEINDKAGKKVTAFIRTDVTKYSDNRALFNLAETEFGGVDFVLLNAGIGLGGNSYFTPLDDEEDEKIFKVNTIGVLKGTKVALLHLAKRGGGSIVHLASCAGIFSSPDAPSYNASKHAVIGYTRSFSLMPQICNVRVNALCPYWVETDLTTKLDTDDEMRLLGELIKQAPHTDMSTVVGGVLNFFVDSTKNAQTALALPDGIHYVNSPQLPRSFHTPESARFAKKYYGTFLQLVRARLAESLKTNGFKASL